MCVHVNWGHVSAVSAAVTLPQRHIDDCNQAALILIVHSQPLLIVFTCKIKEIVVRMFEGSYIVAKK